MQEAQVAIARVLEIAHLVEDGVKTGGSGLQDQLDDWGYVEHVSYSQALSLTHVRLDVNVVK